MPRYNSTFLAAVAFVFFCLFSILRISTNSPHLATDPQSFHLPVERPPSTANIGKPAVENDRTPKKALAADSHPIKQLTEIAQKELASTRNRQSKTLPDAVKEYRRRYGLAPPPHFDKWFEFAKQNEVQLVDEFDTIHELMTPFWGLRPKTIRKRVKEALGFKNGFLGVAIRNHEVFHIEGGKPWQRNATERMMQRFLSYLPDMDLTFNAHDEPRVMVPHDDLARLVKTAKTKTMPASNTNPDPINDFTNGAPELGGKKRFEETKLSRFNDIPQQSSWSNSRMSCSADSPSRILEEEDRVDDLSKYGTGPLGFVFNSTAMSDICLSPSLGSTYGFFDRPNRFIVTHDLFPVFSQSKISSYADILYPSPWYWNEQVKYDEEKDMPWSEKNSSLYWRGSTTGGFSRHGGWRRQHRQHIVQKLNAKDEAKIMVNKGTAVHPKWQAEEAPRGDYRELIDVHFSHVGQCDGGDCEAQKQFFEIKKPADQQVAWGYKHLLDMDGNAFSGRFYAFLRSRSLTFKYAIFREWHSEWIKPWAHYVPLSVQGNDWLESVRYFTDGEQGDSEAQKIAVESREWVDKVVRKVDMEVWFFRLLLEYARVIDDNREIIGFDPASANKKLKQQAN